MITLVDDIIVLDRAQGGDDVLPLIHHGRGGREKTLWFIDIGIDDEIVMNRLIDAEILDEDLPIRYIAQGGASVDGMAHIEELIAGPDGNMCRLRGVGTPPAEFLADEPKAV